MDMFLQVGGNTELQHTAGRIVVSYDDDASIDVSLTAFLLTSADQVEGDSGIVFYNQPTTSSGAAQLRASHTTNGRVQHTLQFDLARLGNTLTKIAVTLTEDNHTGFSNVRNLQAVIETAHDVIELAPVSFEQENGIVVAEL